jgi:alcohol dehydrogenase, propanol-preferring
MRAMQIPGPGRPLEAATRPQPAAGPGQVLIRVTCCGVCRTDLHIIDGELPWPGHCVVPGHEIVGRIESVGTGVERYRAGERVGVPWLGWTCGHCHFCLTGRENLCEAARFTGYHLDGGYAEYAVADARYVFALPPGLSDEQAAPLLCAGLIGYRALRFAGNARRIGLYGFGAAAHIIAQVALHQGREVFAFTRPGDRQAQAFALQLGAQWAGASDAAAPEPLDAALIFAPVGALVPAALLAIAPGGTVVCAGIHMSDIPSFPYAALWRERRIVSVANLTRSDGDEFMELAARTPIATHTVAFELERANEALGMLREGRLQGAAVLHPGARQA